jgi:uroporphyrinogen decarboxylase
LGGMTSRERVMAALSHRQPDRVPMDLGGTRNSSMVVEGYDRLKAHFGVRTEARLIDRMMRIAEIEEAILRAMEIDTRGVNPGPAATGLFADLSLRGYRDMWGVERVWPEGGYYYDLKVSPLSGEIGISDILKHAWPDPDDPQFTTGLSERVRWLRQNTECAVVLNVSSAFVHISQYLRGFEDWFCDFVVDASRLEVLFDAVLDVTLQITKNQLRAVGQDVDIVFCSDDLGTQSALQMSHEHYVKYIKPRHKKFFRTVHDLSPAKLVFHSCGSVASIIEDLIEIGVEGLNPVQPTATGMNPVELKRKYGGRLAFWGGTENQRILPRGSVQEVQRMVEKLIDAMGEGGGFVFSSCHNIQPDVPLENVLAMFSCARRYDPSFAR